MQWAIYCCGVWYVLHYLDDFLLMGAPATSEAANAASLAIEVFLGLAFQWQTTKQRGLPHHSHFSVL